MPEIPAKCRKSSEAGMADLPDRDTSPHAPAADPTFVPQCGVAFVCGAG